MGLLLDIVPALEVEVGLQVLLDMVGMEMEMVVGEVGMGR